MIGTGILLLLSGIALIAFRTRLTRVPFGEDEGPIAIFIPNPSGELTLMVVGTLVALLGIGLILVGCNRRPILQRDVETPTDESDGPQQP
ncbi:MAG: hypothetical protein GXP27_20445 [Planctomycetes bacterium]|nr:hypothetical protein [Planctomycetota bacterium]